MDNGHIEKSIVNPGSESGRMAGVVKIGSIPSGTTIMSGSNRLLNENEVVKGKGYKVTFTFTNNTGFDVTISKVQTGVDMAGFVENNAETDCTLNHTIYDEDQCQIVGTYTPDKPGDTIQALSMSIKYTFGGYSGSSEAKQLLTVLAGQFQYKQGENTVKSLAIKADSANSTVHTITVSNGGKAPISDIAVTIPDEITSFVNKSDCENKPSLATGGDTCSLTVTLPKLADLPDTASGQHTITTESDNADNTPASLYLNILTKGHLKITRDGKEENRHSLAPGSEGTFIVENTGGMAITNFVFTPPSDIFFYFPEEDNTCRNQDGSPYKLDADAPPCEIGYTIPASPDNGTYTLTFKGENADNSPTSILAVVASQGHLIFSHDGLVNNSASTLTGESGTIAIKNLGGTNITNFSVDIPNSINNDQYIASNTCIRGDKTLAVNANCEIKYKIPPEAGNGIYTLRVKGNNFDNADPTFILSVLTEKPLYSFDFLADYVHGNKVESNVAGLSSLTLRSMGCEDTDENTACTLPLTGQIGPKGSNNAIIFSGQGQYAKFDDTSNIISGDFTVDFWGMYDSFEQNWSRIYDLGNGSDSDNVLLNHVDNTQGFDFSVIRGVLGTNPTQEHRNQIMHDRTYINISNFWKLHQWIHATVIVNKEGLVTVYKNGKPINLYAPPIGIVVDRNNQPKLATPAVERKNSYMARDNWNSPPKYCFVGKIASVIIYKGIVPPEPPHTADDVNVRGETTVKLPDNVAHNAIYNVAYTFYNESQTHTAEVNDSQWAICKWENSKCDWTGSGLELVDGSVINGCLESIAPGSACTVSAKVKVTATSGFVEQGVKLFYRNDDSYVAANTHANVAAVAVNGSITSVNGESPTTSVITINPDTPVSFLATFTNTSAMQAQNIIIQNSAVNGTVTIDGSNCDTNIVNNVKIFDQNSVCQVYGSFETAKTSGTASMTITLKHDGGEATVPVNFAISNVKIKADVTLPLPETTEKAIAYPVVFTFTNEGDEDVNISSVDTSGLSGIEDEEIAADDCRKLTGSTLYNTNAGSEARKSCQVKVKFKTGTPGSHTLTLSLEVTHGNDSTPLIYSLQSSTETADNLYLFIASHSAECTDNSDPPNKILCEIFRCTINSRDSINPQNCKRAVVNRAKYTDINSGDSLDYYIKTPGDFVFDKKTSRVFIGTYSSPSQITKCTITSDHLLKDCTIGIANSPENYFDSIRTMALDEKTGRVYIGDCAGETTLENKKVRYCNQGSDGVLKQCKDTRLIRKKPAAGETHGPFETFSCAHGLAFSRDFKHLYVSDNEDDPPKIYRCDVQTSGDLYCTPFQLEVQDPFDPASNENITTYVNPTYYITINLKGTYAYFAPGFNSILKCPIDQQTAAFKPCKKIVNTNPDISFDGLWSIRINPQQTRAYLSNHLENNQYIIGCNVVSSDDLKIDGDLTDCIKVSESPEGSIKTPTGMNIIGW